MLAGTRRAGRLTKLPSVASKKRRPDRRRPSKGLSGNPQRRVQQLKRPGATEPPPQPAQPPHPEIGGGESPWAWWAESHETVLAQARAAQWPSRLVDIENLAGRLAGDEFQARVAAEARGATPASWLAALADKAMDAMAADLAEGGEDWPRLWAFSCGLADDQGAEKLETGAALFAEHAVTPVPALPVPWYQPTEGSAALVARDAYGDRFLVTAPFSDPARPETVDHWYAWDLDWCSNGLVVAAGVYDSPEAARAEWQAAVGPAAATAEFSPCPPELGLRLLAPAQPDSTEFEMVIGDEPAQFFREIPRLSRRAAALTASLGHPRPGQRSGGQADDRDAAIDAFLDQQTGHAWNAQGDRDVAEEALELILSEWGPDVPPDEPAFYACSPHRIESCAAILRDSYDPELVNQALLLLSDWVQWCARRTELAPEFADRALSAARVEAASPAGGSQVAHKREERFRRPE
jgi:hypothetical protein